MSDHVEPERNFLRSLLRKVQIAIAVAVIRIKPENVPTKQFVENLQLLYGGTQTQQSEETSSNSHNPLEDKVLALQQELLMTRLWASIPPPAETTVAVQNFDSSDQLEEIFASGGDEFDAEDEDIFASAGECRSEEESMGQTVEHSIRFIHAIMNLKSAIRSRHMVSATNLQHALNSYFSPYTSLQRSMQMQMTRKVGNLNASLRSSHNTNSTGSQLTFDSLDSGIATGSCSSNEASVSSDTVRYIVRSTETCSLVKQSVKVMLDFLQNSILEKGCSGDHLKSSVVVDAIHILVQILNDSSVFESNLECHSLCLKFVTEITQEIFLMDDSNKHDSWEHWCGLVLDLCSNHSMCTGTIYFLMEKIVKVAEHLQKSLSRKMDDVVCHYDTNMLENSYYLFFLLEKLLEWRNKHNSQEKNPREQKVSTCITSLWRKRWAMQEESEEPREQVSTRESISKWRKSLQESVVYLSEDFPLFTSYVWEIESLLSISDQDVFEM